jgi:hypothetical protein
MRSSHPSVALDYFKEAGNLRSGNRVSRILMTGQEGAPDNFRLGLGSGGDGTAWTTPRHHHNFEQIRWPISGDYSIGKNRLLPQGWVGYFPESAYYGPQVMSPNLTMLVLQFGGPSGQGFASVAQRKAGLDELLASGGTLENGIYSWVDSEGRHKNKDAFEAVWETINKREIQYPDPRYDDLILMNPECFEWIPDPGSPGIHRRHLGTFTEREVKISFIKADAGSTLVFGAEPSSEVIYLKSGEVTHDGQVHPSESAFGSAASDAEEELTASVDSELFYIKLPTF